MPLVTIGRPLTVGCSLSQTYPTPRRLCLDRWSQFESEVVDLTGGIFVGTDPARDKTAPQVLERLGEELITLVPNGALRLVLVVLRIVVVSS